MTTINERLKQLFLKLKPITEIYYESPEGKQYSDYEMWILGVQSKYPNVLIRPEGDNEGAYSGHTSVGYWDHQIQNGIVFDLNVVKKESIDNSTFQATDFTEEELTKIKTIMPDAKLDLSGIVMFGNYALLKYQSGVIDLVKREGSEYIDFKPFKDFNDMITNLKASIPVEKPVVENNQFNIEGFIQNMTPYVNDINNYIEYNENQSTYYINIPFTALKTKLEFANTPAISKNKDVANKIIKIAELYPRCMSSHTDWNKQEIILMFSNKNSIKESLYTSLILEFLEKDEKRIRDIVTKSNGNPMKQLQLATNMANSITDKNKAFYRGTAAAHVLGKDSEVATVFFQRAKELGYPVDAELSKPAKKKVLPGSKLPFDQQHKNKYKGQSLGRHRGNPILPCGSLNFITGDNKYFNVRENGTSTLEIWKSGEGKYKAVITSGKTPIHEIGERATFIHDQNQSFLFDGIMIDYINESSMEELIPLYGKSMMSYVYK